MLIQKWFYLSVAILLLLTGCGTMRVTNLTPAELESEPSIQLYIDPMFDASGYQTFSVFPSSLIEEKIQLGGGILEKQMLFALRNAFEEIGYKFVPPDKSPDFLATLDASAPYKETYIPPQTVIVPYWVPGYKIARYGSLDELLSSHTYGGYATYGWGAYRGSPTILPTRYPVSYTYTRSGYMAGAYYPAVNISVFDAKTMQNVWAGCGIGTAYNPDVRISSQGVLKEIVRKFTAAGFAGENPPGNSAETGIEVSIYTVDGNNYYPVVTKVAADSAAGRAGVAVHDMILAVGDVSTLNKSLSESIKLINGNPGADISLTLWRVDKQLDLPLLRTKRQ